MPYSGYISLIFIYLSSHHNKILEQGNNLLQTIYYFASDWYWQKFPNKWRCKQNLSNVTLLLFLVYFQNLKLVFSIIVICFWEKKHFFIEKWGYVNMSDHGATLICNGNLIQYIKFSYRYYSILNKFSQLQL